MSHVEGASPAGMKAFEAAREAIATGAAAGDAARQVVRSMTADEKLWCLDGDAPTWAGLRFMGQGGYHEAPFVAGQVERLGLEGISFADGPRGCVVGNATCFPVTMARGATWDPELEERVGEVFGTELRAVGANLTGAVCVNVLRHPAWGRAQETYGEEPQHIGEMGSALTRGLQRHVMACVKHFACNSMENARFSVDIEADDVALHEVFLPHFRRIVDEGVASVMSAYNSLNGEWCGQNRVLLHEILREEWGFEGFVISDWIFGLRDAARSLRGGLDVEMPYRMLRAQHLRPALDSGEASWEDVDAAVERILTTLLRFDAVLAAPTPSRMVLGSAEHRALAREVAARSVVLLKNDRVDGEPVLPLRAGASLAVIGPLAGVVNLGDGGSSDVWDLDCVTVLEGLRAAVADVVHDDGSEPGRAASVAAAFDAALIVVGYTFHDEGEYIGPTDPALAELFPREDEAEVVAAYQSYIASQPAVERPAHLRSRPRGFSVGGDRQSLRLRAEDVELIRAVGSANPRTIVALEGGSAVIVSEWIESVPGLVQAWYGGCQAGPGLADVLLGVVNPSARLPFSVPFEESDLPAFDRDATSFRYDRWHGWRHLRRTGRPAAFPFGFGLSYTSFFLAEVAVATARDGSLVVTGTLRNNGRRAGIDVVQVYAEFPREESPPRLVGWARVPVDAGSAAGFEIGLPANRLEVRDPSSHMWRPANRPLRISVARHAGDPDARTFEL